MALRPTRRGRLLRFQRETATDRRRPDLEGRRICFRPPAPTRNGVSAIPAPIIPYQPATAWDDGTPEPVVIVDTLLQAMLDDFSWRELWTFTSHAVERISDMTVVSTARHRLDIPSGGWLAVFSRLIGLTGERIEGPAWVRILALVGPRSVFTYRVTPLYNDAIVSAVFLEMLKYEGR